MALGVLNNLSAIYAENNLNKTSTSLQTVLQQLSSGSKINSGADDAAGLSLVNGLEANSTALTQSETNATEGVGLLDVADGALSQVTSLLDRAITLATEASNGTLNSSQEAAANDEYTSILSEINNIGSTTTYNQERVFTGNTVAIYTGDSSTAGSSIDNLNIATLSESSVGDTNGKMTYTTGESNVFINLSTSTKNASVNDSLSTTGTTSMNVTYLTGSSANTTTATATITVGTGTTFDNTAEGLIQAIDASGLGLSASFTTATSAGTAAVSAASGGGTETGILITGTNIGVGNNAGVVGELTDTSTGSLQGTLTIGSSNITLGAANSTDTLAHLEAKINSGSYGVSASINGSGALVLTSTDSSIAVSGTTLSDSVGGSTALTLSNVPTALSEMSTTAGTIGTLSLTSATANTNTLTGALAIVGADGVTTNVTLSAGSANNTPAKLATYINALNLGVTATASTDGTKITFASTSADSVASVSVVTPIDDTTVGATADYTYTAGSTVPSAYYSTGISGTVTDSTTGETAMTSPAAGATNTRAISADTNGTTGTATTSYTDSAGVSLSGTSLLTPTNAEAALTALNTAISDVAAMDGYIGAQINTLNSLSSVLTTQEENVTSAQNAIQATDYASATSAMSKYEILNQTGIAALAQANSVQQEVTKLLQ
jgi:flagellin